MTHAIKHISLKSNPLIDYYTIQGSCLLFRKVKRYKEK